MDKITSPPSTFLESVNSAISVVVAVLVLSPRSPYGFPDAGWIVINSPTIFAFLSCLNHAANSLASSSETEVVFPGTIGWDGTFCVATEADDASAMTLPDLFFLLFLR